MLLTWLVALSMVMLGGPVLGAALYERRRMRAEAGGTTAQSTSPSAEPSGDEPAQDIPLPRIQDIQALIRRTDGK